MARHVKKPLATAIALAMFAALPSIALAQNEVKEGETAAEKKAEETKALEAVTVTARRREENAQDVPVAISTFEREELRDLQATGINDLQGAVPNLNIVQGRGSSNSVNVFIRGIGQPDALQSFDPGVGMYVDDVYYSRIQGGLFSLFDIERVEVLRGPQGTLYGKNSTGGAIKLVTRTPSFDAPEGSVEGMVGNFGRIDGRFYVSTPIGDTMAISAAGALINSDGYIEDPSTGEEYNEDSTDAFRAKMSWRPSDSFAADFSFDYTHQDDALTLGEPTAPLTQTDLVRGIVVLRPVTPGEYDFETRTSFDPDQGQKLRHKGIAANLTWDFNDAWALKSITAYRKLDTASYVDIDASEFELGDVFVALDQKQFSQELQLQYDNGSNVQAVYGLYYLKEDVPSHQEAYADDFLALNGAPIGFTRTIDDDLETRSFAAFAHVAWEFTPSWTLAAGIRWTDEDKDYDRTTSTFSTLAALNGTFAFTTDDNWSATTPSLSISKKFSDNATAYVSANRGFKSGGFNGRANSAAEVSTFDPEYVWTYEAGLKLSSTDRRHQINFTGFHSDYQDFQARVSEVTNPGAPIPSFSFPVLNAAELSINGVEVEAIALVGDATTLSAQVGWLDAEYEKFEDPRVLVNPALASLHEHVPFSPEWTARIAAQHAWYMGNGSVITLGGDVSWRDDTWLSVDNRAGLVQPSYTLLGLYTGWDSADGAWNVRGGVRNLTDETYKTEGQEFSSVGNIQTAYYGMPRNYYVSLRFNW